MIRRDGMVAAIAPCTVACAAACVALVGACRELDPAKLCGFVNFSWDGTERMASHPPLTLRINDQKTVAAVAREEGTSAELHGITFRWDSDDERVATVSQSIGPQTVVTARGPGRTRIHVGCDREVNDIDLEVLPQ